MASCCLSAYVFWTVWGSLLNIIFRKDWLNHYWQFHPYDVANKLADVLEIEVSLLYDDFSRFLAVPYTEALKSVRTALELSQKAFAEQVGIVPSYYYKIEEGNRRPSRKIYQKICAALEATGLQTSLLRGHPLQWRWKKNDWRSDYGTEFDLYSLRRLSYPRYSVEPHKR